MEIIDLFGFLIFPPVILIYKSKKEIKTFHNHYNILNKRYKWNEHKTNTYAGILTSKRLYTVDGKQLDQLPFPKLMGPIKWVQDF